MTTPRKRGRPRAVALVPLRDGMSIRTTIDVDGISVRRQINAGTTSKAVARAKGKKILSGDGAALMPQEATGGETFREAAERLNEQSALKSKKMRIGMLRKYAYPELGDMLCGDIKVHHIRECLEQAAKHPDIGAWSGSIRHIKNHISSVLGTLYSDGLIAENAALRVSFRRKDGTLGGKRIQRVTLPRIVPTDAEFETFLANEFEIGEGVLGELAMLALCARCLGGMRTSDLHAWRWDHIDIEGWREAKVPRPKTQGTPDEPDQESADFALEPYDLPELLGQHLAVWWERAGRPSEGPVFPVRRGRRAGLHKMPGQTSYAEALRDAFWAAGAVRPLPGFDPRRPQRSKCAIQSGIPGKRARMDFHSMRRASVTATSSDASLSYAESMRLADHSDPRTHAKYRRDETNRVMPESSLPRIMAPAMPKMGGAGMKNRNDIKRARKDSNLRPLASEADSRVQQSESSDENAGDDDPDARGDTHKRQKSLPIIRDAQASLAEMVASAMREGNLRLAADLIALAQKHAPAPPRAPAPTNVTQLDPARRKR